MRPETMIRDGKTFVLLEAHAFEKLIEDSDMLADVRLYDAAKARLALGEDEMIPASVIMRRLEGESTTKIWRELRGLTQEELADASGVSRVMIGAIESKRKIGSVATLKKLAIALNCDLGNLA